MDFMRFQPIRVKDFIRQHLPTVVRQECPYFDPMSKKRFGRTLGPLCSKVESERSLVKVDGSKDLQLTTDESLRN